MPGPGWGTEVGGEETQAGLLGQPGRTEPEREDGERGLGGAGSLPAKGRKAPCLRGRQLTESRRGSIYNLVSLNWYNLYCEAFEMSCDLVTFPFFGAFAPCSDKQLKKKT